MDWTLYSGFIDHGHFSSWLVPLFEGEARCTTFHIKTSFIWMWMKTHFHMKGCAPRLAWKKRYKTTRKICLFFLCKSIIMSQCWVVIQYLITKISVQSQRSFYINLIVAESCNYYGCNSVGLSMNVFCKLWAQSLLMWIVVIGSLSRFSTWFPCLC